MIKNLLFYKSFTGLLILIFVAFLSCEKESSSPIQVQLKTYTGNLQFEFLPQSVEKIFYSQMSWEAKALNYFNIIKEDTDWHMFYNAFAYNQTDFNGSFCVANSADGENWNRPFISNNTNVSISGNNSTGISGACVFKDNRDVEYPYKMICSKLINGNQKTFLYGSHDGTSWALIKKLFDIMQDSQFSVININDIYYVFLRYNDFSGEYQRAIGLAKLDGNLNVIQQPLLLLEAAANSTYAHIYNSGASKINDSTVLLFPTYYDDKNESIQIKLLYTNNMKDYYLINNNINNSLFPNGAANWSIVSPGLIPADEKDTYWVYYYATGSRHNDFRSSSKIDVTYYRIKLVIHQ